MADYSTNKLNAYNSIVDKGVAIHIRRKLESGFNPITETTTGSTLASFSTYTALFSYSNTFGKNNRIKQGDRQALIPAYSLGTVLEAGDVLGIGNSRWEIIDTNPIAPDGSEIIYEAQIRFASFRPTDTTPATIPTNAIYLSDGFLQIEGQYVTLTP